MNLMRAVTCPTCGKKAEYQDNEFRPFCSERCQLIDFGDWADEKFRLHAETSSLTEKDLDELEKTLANKRKV